MPTGWSTRISRTWNWPLNTRTPTIDAFDTSCFSGEYVTGDVSRDYLERLQVVRSDRARALRDARVLRDEGGYDGYGMQVAERVVGWILPTHRCEGVRGQPLCAQAPPAIPGGGSIDGSSLVAIHGPLVAGDAHKGCPRTPS